MRKKLELNKETLRDLSDVDLAEVAGGAYTTTCPGTKTTGTTGLTTQTPVCPSGATWFAGCS